MKTTIKYSYLIFFLAAIFSACKSFDDVNPTDEFPGKEVGESTFNLELVLSESYLQLARAYTQNHLPGAIVLADYTQARDDGRGFAYQSLFEFNRADFRNNGLWSACYSAINGANNVLRFTEGTTGVDNFYPVNRLRLRGEAYYVRAYADFLLGRYYGHQYSDANASTPGIILMDGPATGFDSGPRATVGETYDRILEDLDSAISFLPGDLELYGSFESFQYRAKKHSALALKAKVLHQMNRIDEALLTTNTILGGVPGEINAGNKEMVPMEFQLMTGFDVEELFVQEGVTNALVDKTTNYFITEHVTPLMTNVKQLAGGALSSVFFTDEFMSRYVDEDGLNINSDTVRNSLYLTRTILEDENANIVDTVFIPGKHSLNLLGSTVWGSIRLEDLILTRAECWALKGQGTAAIRDLNLIRKVRGAKIETNTPSKANLVNLIVRERMLEMAGEGDRFFSWKRMGAYNANIENIYNTNSYAAYSRKFAETINWDSPETLFRIPENEINRNPSLSQADQNP